MANYIRLTCEKRALEAYGFSLWEFEVFGQARLDEDVFTIVFEPDEIDDKTFYTVDGWYNLQGFKIIEPATSGIYVKIEKGKAKKIIK